MPDGTKAPPPKREGSGRSFISGGGTYGWKICQQSSRGKQEGVYKAKWGTETGRRPDADRIAEFEGGVPHEMLGETIWAGGATKGKGGNGSNKLTRSGGQERPANKRVRKQRRKGGSKGEFWGIQMCKLSARWLLPAGAGWASARLTPRRRRRRRAQWRRAAAAGKRPRAALSAAGCPARRPASLSGARTCGGPAHVGVVDRQHHSRQARPAVPKRMLWRTRSVHSQLRSHAGDSQRAGPLPPPQSANKPSPAAHLLLPDQ